MIFNSIEFLVFFVAVVGVYWRLGCRWQNYFLLLASYVFYGWWNWRFLSLILLSTVVDYLCALSMDFVKQDRHRKWFLWTSLFVNLGVLGFFKYFNFFAESFQSLALRLGFSLDPFTLNLILPLGISFYTFQTLSYTIDVYRRKQTPTRSLPEFALYVSFFPQLVAGPIERPQNMLPQFRTKRVFDYERVSHGLKLMAWGLFQKMVIADQLATYVDPVYASVGTATGPQLFLATFFFAFQILCDFSGYSDMAIGAAQVLGFKLMQNFRGPYLARSVVEFWRRWHISLSTWFRDYVYIPLGGSQNGWARHLWSILITFLLSGLWHGANWTFVIWGLLHGILFSFSVVTFKLRDRFARATGLLKMEGVHNFIRTVVTFMIVLTTWVFFRADSVADALMALRSMYQGWSLEAFSQELGKLTTEQGFAFLGIFLLLAVHALQSRGLRIRELISRWPLMLRWSVYYGGVFLLWFFSLTEVKHFIYFQF